MNDKNKIRNLLFYIGIPILIILVLTIVYGSQPRQTKTTYELVEYFQKGEVADYEINYGTGAINLTLNDKEKTEVKGGSTKAYGFGAFITLHLERCAH